jgi:hypothetical protein
MILGGPLLQLTKDLLQTGPLQHLEKRAWEGQGKLETTGGGSKKNWGNGGDVINNDWDSMGISGM